jgi:integrase
MDYLATCPNGTIIDFSMVMDCWKAESAARLKRSTAAEYAVVAERRIRPRLGALPAGDVGQAEAAKLIGGLNDAGLAPSTVRLAASVLQSILDYRGQCGVAAGAVKVSRPPEGRTEARVLDASEQAALEKYVLSLSDGAALGVYICLHTGLRVGEICALQWRDVDVAAGTLTVRRTVQRISADGGTQLIVDAPKSRSSRRTLPLSPKAAALIRSRAGAAETYVVTGTGQPMDPRTMQNRFKRMLSGAGVADANFHALRHTFATRCIERGCDPKTLSDILGHADVSTTLNVYVHPSVERMRSCMALLDD